MKITKIIFLFDIFNLNSPQNKKMSVGGEDVGAKYDTIKAISIEERMKRETFHLRSFNNWVKSYLIAKFCPRYCSVLDLASGKGGDIPKYSHKDLAKIVFADISPESVVESYKKIQDQRRKNKFTTCEVRYIVGDTFSNPLRGLPDDLSFHFASCQMALHYAFKSEEMARQAISNLTERLVPGGLISITTINAPKLVNQFKKLGRDRPELGNRLFKIRRHFELNELGPFGCGYMFYLQDSVPSVDEYLLHPQVLVDLFSEYGCVLIEECPFQEFYAHTIENPQQWTDPYTKEVKDPKQLLLQLFNIDSIAMTQDEWEIISYYSYYVFKKDGKLDIPSQEQRPKQPKDKALVYVDAETGEIHEREVSLK